MPHNSSSDALYLSWPLTSWFELGVPIRPEQVALCLIDQKLTRLCHDPKHYDLAVDLARSCSTATAGRARR